MEEIAGKVKLPVLRKDFTVDPYMIYEAKAMRADAVLLICTILREEELMEYLELAEQLWWRHIQKKRWRWQSSVGQG